MFTFSFCSVWSFLLLLQCVDATKAKTHLNKPWAVWIPGILCLKYIKSLKSRRQFVFCSYHRFQGILMPAQPNPPIKSVWRRHDATRQKRFGLMMYLAFVQNVDALDYKNEVTRVQHPKSLTKKHSAAKLTVNMFFFEPTTSPPIVVGANFRLQPATWQQPNTNPPAFHMWSVLWPGAGNGCHGQCKGWKCEGCLKRCGGESPDEKTHLKSQESNHFERWVSQSRSGTFL